MSIQLCVDRRRFVIGAAGVLSGAAFAGPATSAAGKMVTMVDSVEKITWYRDKATPKIPLRSIAFLYMGRKTAAPWLQFKVQYWGDNWLFVEKAVFVVDGEKRGEVAGRWERDNGSGSVWEQLDTAVSSSNLPTIKRLAEAKSLLIRFEGRKYYKDFKVPAADIVAMRNVLAAFDEMGGKA